MVRLINKIVRQIGTLILKFLPLFTFPLFNCMIYRLMGYQLHKTVRLFSSVRILGDIEVRVGKNTFIGHETLIIGGSSRILIGENCDISTRVSIFSGTHEIDSLGVRSAGLETGKDIIIEDGVWIGFGVMVLPGVKIGTKSIIGAGSVVVNNIPPNSIAIGNPCRVIKKWNSSTNSFEYI
jgi:maltose O-acetyltransferase